MAKQTWVNVSGTWRKVKSAWVNVNGTWKKDVMPKGVVNGDWKEFMSYLLTELQLRKTTEYHRNSTGYFTIGDYVYRYNERSIGSVPSYSISKLTKDLSLISSNVILKSDGTFIRRPEYATIDNDTLYLILDSFYVDQARVVVKINPKTLEKIETTYVSGGNSTYLDIESGSFCLYRRENGWATISMYNYYENNNKENANIYRWGLDNNVYSKGEPCLYIGGRLYIVSPKTGRLCQFRKFSRVMDESEAHYAVDGYGKTKILFTANGRAYALFVNGDIYNVNLSDGNKTLITTWNIEINNIIVNKDFIYGTNTNDGAIYKINKESFEILTKMKYEELDNIRDIYIDRSVNEGEVVIKQVVNDGYADSSRASSNFFTQK